MADEQQRSVLIYDAADEYRPEPPPPPEVPAWKDGSIRIGIHTSIAGDVVRALDLAQGLGANALQIFSSSPRMWARAISRPAQGTRARAAGRSRQLPDQFGFAESGAADTFGAGVSSGNYSGAGAGRRLSGRPSWMWARREQGSRYCGSGARTEAGYSRREAWRAADSAREHDRPGNVGRVAIRGVKGGPRCVSRTAFGRLHRYGALVRVGMGYSQTRRTERGIGCDRSRHRAGARAGGSHE